MLTQWRKLNLAQQFRLACLVVLFGGDRKSVV